MEKKFTTHGYPSWIELMTSDMEGAKEFYSKIFNWKINEHSTHNGMKYFMINIDSQEIPLGGIFDKKDAMVDATNIPSHWGNYITVNNIDETILKVQELGGNIIVPKTNIPNAGDFSVIQDPQGAVISIMQYLEIDKTNC